MAPTRNIVGSFALVFFVLVKLVIHVRGGWAAAGPALTHVGKVELELGATREYEAASLSQEVSSRVALLDTVPRGAYNETLSHHVSVKRDRFHHDLDDDSLIVEYNETHGPDFMDHPMFTMEHFLQAPDVDHQFFNATGMLLPETDFQHFRKLQVAEGIDCFFSRQCSTPYYSLLPKESYDQGTCVKGKCKCKNDWTGRYCTNAPDSGYFSCDEKVGTTCTQKINDDKEVYIGNLTVTVQAAKNLPDLDKGWGVFAGVTDPYVKVTIFKTQSVSYQLEPIFIPISTKQTKAVRNSLAPVWPAPGGSGEDLEFGVRKSAQTIQFEVWDQDTGLEFGDDFIGAVNLSTIACSSIGTFALTSEGYPKVVNECVESVWVPLKTGYGALQPGMNGTRTCTGPTAVPCIRIQMRMTAFEMKIKEVFALVDYAVVTGGSANSTGSTSSVSARRQLEVTMAGDYDKATSSGGFGRPYLGEADTIISGTFASFRAALGGIMLRTHPNDKDLTIQKYALIELNYPADVFVFRKTPDFDSKPLSWMSDWEASSTKLQIQGQETAAAQYKSKKKTFQACAHFHKCSDNRTESYEVELGGSAYGYTGVNINEQMYIVIAKAKESVEDIVVVYDKTFSREDFVAACLFHVVPLIIFSLLIGNFLAYTVKMRFDRFKAYLCTLKLSPVAEKSIAASLFEPVYMKSKNNIDFRRNIYYAEAAVYVVVLIPVAILLSFGLNCALQVEPLSMGFAILFIGAGSILTFVALFLWRGQGWRMTDGIQYLFSFGFACVYIFAVLSIFLEPRFQAGGFPLDIGATTAVFFTLNMVPMIVVVFINDVGLKKSFGQLHNMIVRIQEEEDMNKQFELLMGLAAEIKAADKKKEKKKKKYTLGSLISEVYSIDADLTSVYGERPFESTTAVDGQLFSGSDGEMQILTYQLYAFSMFTMVIYGFLVYFYCQELHKWYGFYMVAVTVIMDSLIWLNHRGALTWSPGKAVLLMIVSRMSLTFFIGDYWLLGITGAYLTYGIALAFDVVNVRLQTMSVHDIGAIAFFGAKVMADQDEIDRANEVGGMPEFILGYLSLIYLVLLAAAVFTYGDTLAKIQLGSQQWSMWIFGVIAFVLVILFSLALTTIRAFQLEAKNLLDSTLFLIRKDLTFPTMMALFLQLMTLLGGTLIYAMTESSFTFISLLFLPPIGGLTMHCFSEWKNNDYDILPSWNNKELRLEDWDDEDDEDDDDEEEEEGGGAGVMTAFKLPELKKSVGGATKNIKMPALPMKSLFSRPPAEEKKEADSGAEVAPAADGDAETGADGGEGSAEDKVDLGDDSDNEEEATEEALEGDPLLLKYDPTNMLPLEAFLKFALRKKDYELLGCFALLYFLIFLYGIIVAAIDKPYWFGLLFWAAGWTLLSTVKPMMKWFGTYEITIDMIFEMIFGIICHATSTFLFFYVVLQADFNLVESLWVACVGIGYPTVFVTVSLIYDWYERAVIYQNGWKMTCGLYAIMPFLILLWLAWCFVAYIWGTLLVGMVNTLFVVSFAILLVFTNKWASNGNYLPPDWSWYGDFMIDGGAIFCFGVGMVFDVPLIYFMSFGFILLIGKHLLSIASSLFRIPPGCPIYVAPFVFPMYLYDPQSNDLKDCNDLGANLFIALFYGVIWGTALIIFIDPLFIGVSLLCSSLIIIAGMLAWFASLIPVELGSASRCIDENVLQNCSKQAVALFHKRKEKLKITSKAWEEHLRREAEEARMLNAYASKPEIKEGEDEDFDPIDDANEAVERIFEIEQSFWYLSNEDRENNKYRTDHPFTIGTSLLEIAKGTPYNPMAYAFGFGVFYQAYEYLFGNPNKVYNADGSRKKPEEEGEQLEVYPLLAELPEMDKLLDDEYYEEMRALVHMQVLMLVESLVRIRKESTQFQRFLRENRFRLLANGVKPPGEIFKSRSYATINVELVAHWLIRLTPEQRERFVQLKDRFTQEMNEKDDAKDRAEMEAEEQLQNVIAYRQQREWEQAHKRYELFQARRLRRNEQGIEPPEGEPEEDTNAKETLAEIASGWSCKPGQYGRALQYHDEDFPATMESIGDCSAVQFIKDWKVASGININAGLFDGGTDPDDVYQGTLHDAWLLSAIQILSASGGVDDGEVDFLIDRLFVTKETPDAGSYAIKFYFNSQWEVVIVDDFFPCMDDEYKASKCAGAAFAYSKDFEELWVPLMEKAYAKYYGNYGMLQYGAVHLALHNLTGAESESVSIGQATRGANRRMMWKNLLKYKMNGYLMGCGSVTADVADKEVQESGLVFGATYTIYEVREIDGHCLIKLRNPPGDHGEWKGDWGDSSPVWTRRLKKILGWVEEEDGCFWISWDDFCLSFQYIYIAKYYDPRKWKKWEFDGWWRDKTAAGLPGKHNPKCVVENNPQYSLQVIRPTDFCFHLRQVENGCAPEKILPVSMFLCKMSPEADRSELVTELTNLNVICHTGDATEDREYRLYRTLEPGFYTILFGTFGAEMEGPFNFSVIANYDCKVAQLFPHPWKEGEGPPLTMKERLLQQAQRGMEAAAKLGEAQMKKMQEEAMKQIEENTDWIDKDAEKEAQMVAEKEEEEEEKKLAELREKCPWLKQTDKGTGQVYYYNVDTGMSVWEKPDDYVEGGRAEREEAERKAKKKADKKAKKAAKRKLLEKQDNSDDEDDEMAALNAAFA